MLTRLEEPFARRTEVLAVALLSLLALTRVVSTYPVFNQTFDEPTHIAAGMEWLDKGTYLLAVQNPPLGRIATAIGPYLAGVRLPPDLRGPLPVLDAGNRILYAGGGYLRMLSLARSGNLFWFLAGIAMVWAWGRILFGQAAGIAAVAVFSHTPAVLAYASLATTEMPLIAALGAALLAVTLWLDEPTLRRALLAGLAAAAAILCKLLSVVFLPVAALALLALRVAMLRREERRPWALSILRQSPPAAVAGFFALWACYRFSVLPAGRLSELLVPRFVPAAKLLGAMQRLGIPMPAPELFAGVEVSWAMNYVPQYRSYFMGELSGHGWRWFYPVVLAVKTPIPLMMLVVVGAAALGARLRARRDWKLAAPLVAAAAMLLATITINVDTGVRYVSPIYGLLAVVASAAALNLVDGARHKVARVMSIVPFALLVVSCSLAHPDYLAFFNVAAGKSPERIVVDGDLDWGQDLLRLADEVDKRQIHDLSIAYFGTALPDRHITSARVRPLPPNTRATGWIAVSQMVRVGAWGAPGGYAWLALETPVAKIGHSILLYYIAPR